MIAPIKIAITDVSPIVPAVDVYKRQVKNVTDFGAFIDRGGVDGLLHISEMSWGRVETVSYTHLDVYKRQWLYSVFRFN